MMVVMPTFTQDKKGQKRAVHGIVTGVVPLTCPPVTPIVHGRGGVQHGNKTKAKCSGKHRITANRVGRDSQQECGNVVVTVQPHQLRVSGQILRHRQDLALETTFVQETADPAVPEPLSRVFQDHKLLYDRPVFDNVALPLIIAGLGHRDAGRRVRAALDQVGLLHKEKQNPQTLSAGEQQRVGIARAIVTRPKLLIADEPTGNLDPDLSLEVMRIFRRFNEVGVTLLIASHDISLIDRLGCRRIALEEGRLQQEVDPWQ